MDDYTREMMDLKTLVTRTLEKKGVLTKIRNVPPAVLVRFLREHRSEWADFNVDAYSAASLKASSYTFPGMRPTRFTGSQIIMPLGHTIEHEEILEIIRLESHSLPHEDAFVSRDIHLLQICNGVDEHAVGACSELIFAPIDEMFPDDAPLLPSRFRIFPLDSKTVEFILQSAAQTKEFDVEECLCASLQHVSDARHSGDYEESC